MNDLVETPSADVVERDGRLRTLVLAVLVALVAAGAEWVTHQTTGYIRADVLVLIVVFAESVRRLNPVVAVVVMALTTVVVSGNDAASILRLAIAVAVAVGCAIVLRRLKGAPRTPPSVRFALAAVLLIVIAAVGTLFQLANHFGPIEFLDTGDFWVRFFRRFVPMLAAVMLGAAAWSRPVVSRQPRWLARLSLGFIVIALMAIAPYLTSVYWAQQEEDTLSAAAATASAALDAGLGDDLNAYLARAGEPPRTPFVNQAGFAAVNQPLLLGNTSISALALLGPLTGDSHPMKYEIDRQGSTLKLASILGADPADAAAINRAADAGAPVLLGIRNVPGAENESVPSLVYVVPQASKEQGAPEFLAVAMSVPVNMVDAIRNVGPDAGNIHFSIDQVDPPAGTAPLALGYGPAPKSGAVPVSAPDPISLGDIPVMVTATAADGLGVSRLQQMLTLLGEVLIGLVVLLLFLTATNSRFRIQRSLEQREALLAAAIESSPGLVMLINRSQSVVMANEIDAVTQESLVGRHALAAMPFVPSDSDLPKVRALLESALAGNESTIECVDSVSHDTLHIYEVAATPVAYREDVSAAALVQVIDVTDARRTAMRSAQSERLEALGAMAGGLAHDFNNLLFIINGYLQLMQSDERIRSQDDLERYVAHAGDAAERGAEIAKSLLSVTRSQPLNASAVNVGTFLHGIMPLARQALGENRTVDLRIGDGTLDVMVDPGQLSSSLLNLVINARDATEPGGSVLLSAQRRRNSAGEDDLPAGDYVVIEVVDDGEGMSSEVAVRAFEPFYSTKAVGQGSGLGLASVYSFARQSGGTAVISSKPGMGASVSIIIPAVFGGDAAVDAVAAAEGSNTISRVLIVDDEQTLAGLVAGWVKERGVEVRVADSMESALAAAEEFNPDALLTDMNIGADVDGLDVAARILIAHPDITVVFMTGFSDRMVELQRRGMVTLAKPFGRQDLYRVLFETDGGTLKATEGPGVSQRSGSDGGKAGGGHA